MRGGLQQHDLSGNMRTAAAAGTKKGKVVGLHIVPYRGKFASEAGTGLYLNLWPRGRGILPHPALPEDIRKALSPSQKKNLKAVIRQAIHE